jgi:hypothetical protein
LRSLSRTATLIKFAFFVVFASRLGSNDLIQSNGNLLNQFKYVFKCLWPFYFDHIARPGPSSFPFFEVGSLFFVVTPSFRPHSGGTISFCRLKTFFLFRNVNCDELKFEKVDTFSDENSVEKKLQLLEFFSFCRSIWFRLDCGFVAPAVVGALALPDNYHLTDCLFSFCLLHIRIILEKKSRKLKMKLFFSAFSHWTSDMTNIVWRRHLF